MEDKVTSQNPSADSTVKLTDPITIVIGAHAAPSTSAPPTRSASPSQSSPTP
jgi:beta-lactam-binding protein with PASTA domain